MFELQSKDFIFLSINWFCRQIYTLSGGCIAESIQWNYKLTCFCFCQAATQQSPTNGDASSCRNSAPTRWRSSILTRTVGLRDRIYRTLFAAQVGGWLLIKGTLSSMFFITVTEKRDWIMGDWVVVMGDEFEICRAFDDWKILIWKWAFNYYYYYYYQYMKVKIVFPSHWWLYYLL